MTRERIAVVGHAAVTCLGRDLDTTWRALIAGRSGIKRHPDLLPADRFHASDPLARESSHTPSARMAHPGKLWQARHRFGTQISAGFSLRTHPLFAYSRLCIRVRAGAAYFRLARRWRVG